MAFRRARCVHLLGSSFCSPWGMLRPPQAVHSLFSGQFVGSSDPSCPLIRPPLFLRKRSHGFWCGFLGLSLQYPTFIFSHLCRFAISRLKRKAHLCTQAFTRGRQRNPLQQRVKLYYIGLVFNYNSNTIICNGSRKRWQHHHWVSP